MEKKLHKPIGIDENRINHMLEVGRMCYELARDIFDLPKEEAEQMFVMGILHDIGYEFLTSSASLKH